MNRITVQVCSKDRHSELALLLQSLRTQSYQEWDLMILDDASGSPISGCGFLMALTNRIKLENHKLKIIRNDFSKGVCMARNKLIESDTYNNPLVCRLDDDVVLQYDYLERLVRVIEQGYDIASGVTPLMSYPEIKRANKFIDKIINKHELDKEGNLILNRDECGYCYEDEGIYLTHQFRSNALYKKEITDNGVRYPDILSFVGFREELWFSFRSIIKGYKIGVDVQAIVYHFQTSSGGTRCSNYFDNVKLDEETTKKQISKWYKKYGDFLKNE